MAFKNLIAFGAGEITPELYERGNLEKFRTGLKSLRNATVTKMGGLRGRGGTVRLAGTFENDDSIYLFIPELGKLYAFSDSHLRIYSNYSEVTNNFGTVVNIDTSSSGTIFGPDIVTAHLSHDERNIYITAPPSPTDGSFHAAVVLNLLTNVITDLSTEVAPPFFGIFTTSGSGLSVTTGGTGYDVLYGVSTVLNGVESFIIATTASKVPAADTQNNALTFAIDKVTHAAPVYPEQVRFYRRPTDSDQWGLVGVSGQTAESNTLVTYKFKDVGGGANFEDRPPVYQSDFQTDSRRRLFDAVYARITSPKTSLPFQGRLVFPGTVSKHWLFGTRTASLAMTRDFPLQDDSAIAFKNGSNGGALVNRLFDGRGLLIFTNVGVYETPNVLTPQTAYSTKRSNFVADDKVPPLGLGNYVVFPDARISAIMGMIPTGNDGSYSTSELSIWSAHLFEDVKVRDWIIQDDDTQVLWIVMSNGELRSFSFQEEHQLRSWARHDTAGLFERVVVIKTPSGKSIPLFQVNRKGQRSLERLTDHKVELMDYVGSDSSVVYKSNLLASTAVMTLDRGVNPWDGNVTLTSTNPAFANTAGIGQAGSIFRIFKEDLHSLDLQVVTYTNTSTLVVKVIQGDIQEFFELEPADTTADIPNLYRTANIFTGLNHLEGEKVTVRLDGYTHASPLNTKENEHEYVVTGGQISLDNGERGAIVSIGLPYVTDIQTLEVQTVEQKPTKHLSQICNSMYLSYFKSRELYAAANYPNDDTITGMNVQAFQYEDDNNSIAIAPRPLVTDEREIDVQGDWKTNGSMALRNVDPQPIGLRAITLNLEVKG